MRIDDATPRFLHDLVLHVIAYALWVATMLMSMATVLQVRVAVSAVWVAAGGDRYTASFIDQVSILLGGFVAFVYVMCLEHYYRDGVTLRIKPKPRDKIPPLPEGRVLRGLAERGLDVLLRRFAVTFGIPLCLFLLSLAAYKVTLDAMTALR